MANISDATGTISFIFSVIDEEFNESDLDDKRSKEEKLKIAQAFCDTVNKETNMSDYAFYLPEVSLDDFAEDGNIYNLSMCAYGRWFVQNNFEWFKEKGFLNEIIKNLGIVKNVTIEFDYNETETAEGWLSINNGASVIYNNIGEVDVNCFYGSDIDFNVENLISNGLEDVATSEIDFFVEEADKSIKKIKNAIFTLNLNSVAKETDEILSILNNLGV